MEALETQGFFEAVYDSVSMETLEELFGPVLNELFALPPDIKMRNHSDKPLQGYIPAALQRVSTMRASSEVVGRYVGNMRELEMMVRRMVVEALGVEKEWESLEKSVVYGLRMTEYDAPVNQETMVTMPAHRDMIVMTIIRQQEGRGLEIQTKDDRWLLASPNSFNVVIGESFQVPSS
ncbi:hypothetical protein J5N97_001685 [Dioscorea zingiberensis]|uniref:Isopenicillin N synthase-like Fe(2+) 2OG dioxygenase domain-containing protein n=1 Tax=Dioscorea zingiberensis TaxID=325984 RepID=A0A9D5BTA0_9LILI|nr:hypothetical protein J5N97_001685 [Dioscorea zingiberensis]